ncbi:phosphotransferase system sugar-specific EII component [Streptococcus pneumoniae]|nr:phosphotransferase system sugar-specific EII component [Streptococcus pneumoniae]CIZ67151.1 phosphotransferase system sugar-specific EII component [Streptococcus pneumoniae]CJW88469.1 phosphotransferase system sugar-specific EII component [Streptococcus pneumoniae]
MIKILAACGAGVNSSHQIKSALEEELSNRGYDVHCDAVMVKDVNEDLMKGYDIFTPIAATDLGFEPGIPVIEAGTYREALITREKSFPTGLDMEFLGKDLPNVAIPHTDIVHNLAEKVVVVRLEKPVTFHNMIAPDKEVEVSLLFFIINNSSSSQTNILAQLMDFFTGNGHLEDLSKISEPEKLYAYIDEAIA